MSRIRANQITNQSADGAPTVQHGLVISGVTTSTTFSGSGASLTNIPSAQLTGALPALDGSELTGISGFATALSPTPTSPLFNIFKTSKTLTVGSGLSVTVESDVTSGNIAFMRETNIHVSTGSTFHIGSGTTLFTNVLNLF